MGCGDHWPRCNGEWFPPLDLPTLIESSHRWVAAVVSLLVASIAVVALRRHRSEPELRNPAMLAAVAPGGPGAARRGHRQAGPPAVRRHHPFRQRDGAARGAARGGAAGRERERSSPASERSPPGPRLVPATAGRGFVVILFGAQVANFDAGLLCLGFPLCNGSAMPPAGPLAQLHWAHRALAFGFLVLLGLLAARVRSDARPESASLRVWTAAVVAATLVQVGVAAAMVLQLLPTGLRALHLLVGTAIWAALVILTFHSRRTAELCRGDRPGRCGRRGPRSRPAGRPGDAHQAPDHLAAAGDDRRPDVHHAGGPALAVAGALGGARRIPDGGRGQRHQHVVRPGHRHQDEPDPAAPDSLRADHPRSRPRLRHRHWPRSPSPCSGSRSIR